MWWLDLLELLLFRVPEATFPYLLCSKMPCKKFLSLQEEKLRVASSGGHNLGHQRYLLSNYACFLFIQSTVCSTSVSAFIPLTVVPTRTYVRKAMQVILSESRTAAAPNVNIQAAIAKMSHHSRHWILYVLWTVNIMAWRSVSCS